jgi:hypothetical protein
LEQFESGWAAVRIAAKKALESKALWRRIDARTELAVTSVDDNRIWVRAGAHDEASLTPEKVEHAMASLNKGNGLGRAGKLSQKYSIWEQALIFLHPQLNWDFARKGEFIIAPQPAVAGAVIKRAASAVNGHRKSKINADEAWRVVRNNAEMARVMYCTFSQPGLRARVTILFRHDESITVAQGGSYYCRVTSEWVYDVINQLNEEGELRVPDQPWIGKAKLNSLAFLHPQLGWDESGKFVCRMY